MALPEVSVVDSRGVWKDKNGVTHRSDELKKLAEERLEQTDSSNNDASDSNVYDNDGGVDSTDLFRDREED